MSEVLLGYAGDAGLFVCFASILVFVLRYMKTKWRTFSEGRHMMVFSAVVLVALGWGSYTVLFDENETATLYVRILIWWSLAAVLIWRDWILFRAQKRKKARNAAAHAMALTENVERDSNV